MKMDKRHEGGTMRDPGSAASVGMITAWGRLAGALAVVAAAVALMGGAPHRTISELRVCADPYNMPFSDDREQRSEEHTSELQSRSDLVCRLLLEKKKK